MPTVEERLLRLETEHAVRACMNRYMALCDALDLHTPIDELAALFCHDALWTGKGARYADSFGAYHGRAAIKAMLASYMKEPAHFAMNAHFLTSELIAVAEDLTSATGSWLMLQTSTFQSGGAHLNAARLTVEFRPEEGNWRMARFETENIFSRPVDAWQDATPLPVPEQ
jgi:hypothetical protein